MPLSFALGIDIGATKTVLTLIDSDQLYPPARLDSHTLFTADPSPADLLATAIQGYLTQQDAALDHLQGVVIGVPATVDPVDQVVTACPNLDNLAGYPLGAELAARLHLPVLLDNDCNLMALGEYARGAGQGVPNLACVYVGTGLGAGLILNGQILEGADGAAAEIGHAFIIPGGRLCSCGRRGCLEMYSSGKALALQAGEILDLPIQAEIEAGSFHDWHLAEDVIRAADGGNARARAAVEKVFYYLGLGIVNLACTANPKRVLIGGGIVSAWPDGIEIVRQTVREQARYPTNERLQVERVILNEQASAVGAYVLLQQRLKV